MKQSSSLTRITARSGNGNGAAHAERFDMSRTFTETQLAELEMIVSTRHTSPKPAESKPASAAPAPSPAPRNGDISVGEEVAMSVEVKRPVIDVTVRKYVLELDDENTQGRIAILLSEGFIDSPKRIQDFYPEFRARGWMKQTGAPTPLNLPLAKLTEMGFLRMVGTNTYQSIPGMKVNVREVQTVA